MRIKFSLLTPKQKQLNFLISVLVFGMIIVWNQSAYANGFIYQIRSKQNPTLTGKTSTYKSYYACYEYGTGMPVNCTFTHTVLGLTEPTTDTDNNGGHINHTGPHPITLNNSPISFPGDTNNDPLVVEGQTHPNSVQIIAIVSHDLPLVSGNISSPAFFKLVVASS